MARKSLFAAVFFALVVLVGSIGFYLGTIAGTPKATPPSAVAEPKTTKEDVQILQKGWAGGGVPLSPERTFKLVDRKVQLRLDDPRDVMFYLHDKEVVYVDGTRLKGFTTGVGPDNSKAVVFRLPPGEHTVEIKKSDE